MNNTNRKLDRFDADEREPLPMYSKGRSFRSWEAIVPAGTSIDTDGRFMQYETTGAQEKRFTVVVDLYEGTIKDSYPSHLRTEAALATNRFVSGKPARTFLDYRNDYLNLIGMGALTSEEAEKGDVLKGQQRVKERLQQIKDDEKGSNRRDQAA